MIPVRMIVSSLETYLLSYPFGGLTEEEQATGPVAILDRFAIPPEGEVRSMVRDLYARTTLMTTAIGSAPEAIKIFSELTNSVALALKIDKDAMVQKLWSKYVAWDWNVVTQSLQTTYPLLSVEKVKRFAEIMFKKKFEDAKMHLTAIAVNYAVLGAYGLQKSAWTPEKDANFLKQEIESRGPLLVNGQYGPRNYEISPKRLNPLSGEELYGWPKGAQKVASSERIYVAILVVGISIKDGLQRVYFRDLNFPHTLVISFDNLVSSLYSTFGEHEEKKAIPGLGYAFYNPQFRVHETIVEIHES